MGSKIRSLRPTLAGEADATSVFQHPFVALSTATSNGVVPIGVVLIKNIPLLPVVAAVNSIALRTEEWGVFQVERMQYASITTYNCRTKGVELFPRHDRSEGAGKALSPDLG